MPSDHESVESGEISDEVGVSSQEISKKRTAEQIESNDGSVEPLTKRPREDSSRMFYGCSKYEDYEILKKIGEGTFGEVSTAKHKKTGSVYALKKILIHNEKEGIPITALREIKILKSLSHPNITELTEIAFQKGDRANRKRGTIFMVFPYSDHDLTGLLENPVVKFTQAQIKSYIQQLLEGTAYLHLNKILHRDMKCNSSNILIDNAGVLKLADFGLARLYTPEKPDRDYTNNVVTRWYRPPELFLGETKYSAAIDMWGVGCVIAEIFRRRPLLMGSSDVNQLELTFQLCGTPLESEMVYFQKLPTFKEFVASFRGSIKRCIREKMSQFDPLAVDLIDSLLRLVPGKRLTAEEALDHSYFFKDPAPARPGTEDFSPFPSSHEFDTRKAKQERAEAFKNLPGSSSLTAMQLQHQPEPHYYTEHNKVTSSSSNSNQRNNTSGRNGSGGPQGHHSSHHSRRNEGPRNHGSRGVDRYEPGGRGGSPGYRRR